MQAKFAVSVGVIVVLASSAGLVAQETGWQTRGMFGPRTFGAPLSPAAPRYVPGLQNGPSGNFVGVGRPDGASMFAAPWRRVEVAPVYVQTPTGDLVSVPSTSIRGEAAVAQPAPPMQMMPAAETGQPEAAPAVAPGAENVEVAPVGEAAAGADASAAAAGGAGSPAFHWSRDGAPRASATVDMASLRASPELSARMTRIANTRGFGTSAGITVLLGERTAVLQGTVTTPHARAMLANVTRLEPGIAHVDNRLTVQP